jgi:hypothetical protein
MPKELLISFRPSAGSNRAGPGFILLAIVSLLIFPTAAAAQAQAPLPPKSGEAPVLYGLQFPDMIAGFQRGNVKDYETEHPGLGYSAKYSSYGWSIDVYIYDDGFKDIPDSLSSERVTTQFAQARNDIYAMQQSRKGKVEDGETFQINSPAKVPRFTCGSYRIVDANGRLIDSFLCLTAWKGKFVKYRLSTLQNKDSTAIAKRFVGEWEDQLWPNSDH